MPDISFATVHAPELAKVDADDKEVKAQYLDYLRQYRACLAEKDIDRLEDEWRVLDVKWMQIRCVGACLRQHYTTGSF